MKPPPPRQNPRATAGFPFRGGPAFEGLVFPLAVFERCAGQTGRHPFREFGRWRRIDEERGRSSRESFPMRAFHEGFGNRKTNGPPEVLPGELSLQALRASGR